MTFRTLYGSDPKVFGLQSKCVSPYDPTRIQQREVPLTL